MRCAILPLLSKTYGGSCYDWRHVTVSRLYYSSFWRRCEENHRTSILLLLSLSETLLTILRAAHQKKYVPCLSLPFPTLCIYILARQNGGEKITLDIHPSLYPTQPSTVHKFIFKSDVYTAYQKDCQWRHNDVVKFGPLCSAYKLFWSPPLPLIIY